MHIHVQIKRWVIWWVYVGAICGVIAGANILGHNLTVFQERLLLVVGSAFWLLGGVVCWAYEAVAVEPPAPTPPPATAKAAKLTSETEWHPASDFLLPGRGRTLLPWKH